MDLRSRTTSLRTPVSFWLLIALLALFAGGKAILFDTMDPDCFWHLRVAEELRAQGIGPIVDTLSLESIHGHWTPYCWLAELGMKQIWDIGGFRAAIATQAFLQASFIVLLALMCLAIQKPRTPSGLSTSAERSSESQEPSESENKTFKPRYLPAALATAAGAFLSLAYFSFRPVTFALVLLALCAWLWSRDRATDRTRAVWLLIPLTALITNIHLFSFFVPGWIVIMTAAEYFSKDPIEVRANRVRRYSWLAVGTSLAFLCTPMLPGLIRTIFFYGTQDPMVRGPVISEMQSFARGPMGLIAAAIVFFTFLCTTRHHKRLPIGEWICLILATLLLFKLGRFSPIFVMLAMPALALTFPRLSDRVLFKPVIAVLLAVVFGASLSRVALAFPKHGHPLSAWLNRNGPDAPGYPCEAAEFVDHAVPNRTGHLINEFSWGGYLAWRLADKYQVLLDGRTQVYPASLWKSTYLGSDEDVKDFLANVTADAAVLPKNRSRFRNALVSLGWQSVYHDDRAEVLLPPTKLTTETRAQAN